MSERTVTASELRAKLYALLDQVATSGRTLVITKRGRPIARLCPVSEVPSLLGSVTFNVPEEELLAPFDDWDVDG